MKLIIKDLDATLQKKKILHDINLEANPGNLHVLVGPNGAGKTTLLKTLAGFIEYSGVLLHEDVNLQNLSTIDKAQKISYMPQFADVPSLNVLQVLELGRYCFSGAHLKDQDRAILDEIIAVFGLQDILQISIDRLSGGQRQKIFLASALAQEPKILLLDEPISHLDPKNQLDVLRTIRKITKLKEIITVIVLHDMQHALHYGDKIWMMKEGKILYNLDKNGIEAEHLNELFDVHVKLFKQEKHTFVFYEHTHDNVGH